MARSISLSGNSPFTSFPPESSLRMAFSENSIFFPPTDRRTCIKAPSSALLSSRSEEHTSELQSLMRISYAVFCLKKKINSVNTAPHTTLPLPPTYIDHKQQHIL